MTQLRVKKNLTINIPTPGSIVNTRGREWVVLPQNSRDKKNEVLHLRPLGGGDQTIATLFWPLEGDTVKPASFNPPNPKHSGAQSSALLLRDAFLLKLRAGAGPFRSLGNIAIEPRPYQLVPLLMALKQSTTRILIADEVGLGKTVEALLIARELLDRGEIEKITVICPPHLCEKWRIDMVHQFNLAVEVIRPGTAQKLERGLPAGKSIFDIVPFTIVSLDWIKSDRNRESFVRSCGEFVIVDEAHTCAARKGGGKQQRYQLLKALAKKEDRHILLLTATPHSGDSEAFDNLLGLLDHKFQKLSEIAGGEERRDLRNDLGNYFIQRRRQDIKQEWGIGGADFPDRETSDSIYTISGAWGNLFNEILDYARELVRRSDNESKLKKRMSWWAALALLRCASSSPAAAAASLRTKLVKIKDNNIDVYTINDEDIVDDLEKIAQVAVLDGTDDELSNEESVPVTNLLVPSDAIHLESLISRSIQLQGKAYDPKLKQLIKELVALHKEKYHPVIFCRFRPTAHYLGEQLNIEFSKSSYIIKVVTGDLTPDERIERINDLQFDIAKGKIPILVATDCLSEGIDLQHLFDAVIHYDLCWNPTRHEQREGRVDRFGQSRAKVRALMLHGGESNPIDERVRTVILEKERTIRKELGVSVPIPGNSNAITEVVLGSILRREEEAIQTSLDLGLKSNVSSQLELEAVLDKEWESAKEKAKSTRTIFAQRSLKPEEALKEWDRTQESIGNELTIERMVLSACRRLNLPIGQIKGTEGCWELDLNNLNNTCESLADRFRQHQIEGLIQFGFRAPLRKGIQLIGRSHPLVVELAGFVAERAMTGINPAPATRSSVIRTRSVTQRTQLLLIRLRHQLHQERWSGNHYEALPDLLVEECLTVRVINNEIELLEGKSAIDLMEVEPFSNIESEQRQYELTESLTDLKHIESSLKALSSRRAQLVEDDHRRVREASLRSGESLRMRFNCEPAQSLDVIGLFLFLPAPIL